MEMLQEIKKHEFCNSQHLILALQCMTFEGVLIFSSAIFAGFIAK